MAGIFPHPSADAQVFRPGDPVKYFINENEISPYTGRVSEICPAINKVWVEFPVGGNQQFDPMDLILVPPTAGLPTVKKETGYSNYDKELSKENYGTMEQKLREKAAHIARKASFEKMASGLAKKFARDIVEKLAEDILSCYSKNLSDIQAYQEVYPKYEKTCSDGFIRFAIEKIYEENKNLE